MRLSIPLAIAFVCLARLFAPTTPADEVEVAVRTLQEADDWARSFQGPVRLEWGMRDPILGRTLHAMKKLFPDAEVTEIDAGHFLQDEVPEQLVAAIPPVLAPSASDPISF